MQITPLELNPELELASLANELSEHKKVRIENVLTDDSAEAISETLKQYTAWQLAYTDKESKPATMTNEELNKLSDAEYNTLKQDVYSRAAQEYQFMYKFFPIINGINAGTITDKSMLFHIASFLNGTEFIKFARQLTNHNSLVKVDPQASLYEGGHFLNLHDDISYSNDINDQSIRRYAIVLGFTKNWSVNWGGNTSFYTGANFSSSETWYPGFNTLTVFEVPALHRVNFIAPYAPKGRYSITGWLRDDPTISRPDLDDA